MHIYEVHDCLICDLDMLVFRRWGGARDRI